MQAICRNPITRYVYPDGIVSSQLTSVIDTALDIKDETVGLAEHSQDVHFSDDFSDAEVIPPSEAISLSSEAENEPMPEEEPVENISEAPVEEEIKPHHREKELDISSHKKKKKKGSKTPFWDE